MWEIKGKDNQVKATVGSLEYNGEWMGESYVTVTVESPAPVNFEIGDYIIYRDERFEINYDPGKIKSAPRYEKGDAFKYENIKFNSLADELTRCDFLDIVLNDNQLHFTGLPKFSFYGGVKDLANRMQANLDRTYGKGTWSVVVSPEFQSTKEVNISVDTIKVQGALSILVNDLETYYTIKGRTITIGAAGIPAGHLFKYGKGNGLYEIEQNAEADQAIVTRLRAYGSTRNLPHRYYNSLSGVDGKKLIPDNMAVQYLMLPEFPYTTQDPYIDSPNIAKLGIREGTVFFDGSGELEEIYPSIEGMTAEQLKTAGVPCNSTGALDEIVSAEQMTDNGVGEINEGETQTTAKPPTFKVTLKDLGFDINDHLTTETATLSFKTGMLGGRDFEIVGCKKIESGGKVTGYELELNRVHDDGIKLWFPYSAYNAQAGDKFVLLYIEMPEVYIKAASQRLKEAATEWLSKNDYSRSIYAPKVDENFMARQHDLAMASGGKIKSLHDTLKEGMLLLFEDEDLNIDASIFIDRLTIKEEGAVPTYEVVLKEEKTVGRLDKMQNQIDSLVAGKGQGGGGYTAAQIRSMIEAYGGTRFLSKIKDDRSTGKISSDKGFEAGEFVSGVSGGIFGIDLNTGDSLAEVARLYVRVKAFFEELTVIKSGVIAGKNYITPGGGVKCARVDETTDASGNITRYRCYFLSEQDGEKTECKFVAGDQAISEMFNAKTGTSNKVSNHRYWRLVTAVNNDAYTDDSGNHYGYIELSVTDCEEGSDIPQAGDEICQLGNRNQKDRQSAMVLSTVDSDAPSIKLFGDIDTYSLADKAIISFGRDPITGQIFFRLGASDAKQFLSYNQNEGLVVAGAISSKSTIDNKKIHNYVEEAAKAEAEKAKKELEGNIKELQDQIDGVVEAWNGMGAPTLTNYPANQWTTEEERKRHERDIYTDITPYVDDATTPTSGQSWKWYYNSPTDYGWVKVADSDAIKALQLAQISVRDTDVLFISHGSANDAPVLPVTDTNGVITDAKGWQTTAPEWRADRYIWQTTYVRKGDGTASFSDPTCIQGAKGEQGPQGIPGKAGADGQPTYTWIRYADDANGGGMSNDPAGKKYMGLAYNKTTAVESNNPADYAWSLIKGDKGDQGVPGQKGADGTQYWTWIKYSDNPDGTGMYDTPNAHTKYIGIAVNKTSQTESNKPSDYTWSMFQGPSYTNNLLLNSAFIYGFDNWSIGSYGAVNTAHMFEGRKSVRILQSGLTANQWRGISQSVPAAPGEVFTASIWSFAENPSSIDNGAEMEVWALNSSKDRIGDAVKRVNIKPSKANEWQQAVAVNAVMPANTAYVQVYAWVRRNGTLWLSSPKLERGINPAPQWSPAAEEMVGTPAQVVVVNADALVFQYENGFATLLSPQKITLSASVQGIANPTYQWSYRQADQTGFTDITAAYGRQPTLEVNPNGECIGNAESSTVRCTVNGTVHDEVTIVRVSSGSDGAEGADYTENLLLGSGTAVTNSLYPTQSYRFSTPPVEGKTYTCTLWGRKSPNPARGFAVFNSNGYVVLADMKEVEDGVYRATFKWKVSHPQYPADNTHLRVYETPHDAGACGPNTIDRIKLEEGDNPKPVWTPAPSDSDAYTVILTNESHIFEGDTEKAVAGHTDCGVIVYKGNRQVAATIGAISGTVAGKLTVDSIVDPTATAQGSFRVNVTTALKQKQGTLNVPVTVDGRTFTKVFSWSLSLQGKAHSIAVKSYGYYYTFTGGNGYVKVDGKDVFDPAPSKRGINMVTLNRQTLAKTGQFNYDLYTGNTNVAQARTNFINKINSLDDSVFVCLLFADNVTWTPEIVTAMKKLGSLGDIRTDGASRTFAFIGYKGLQPGYALQAQGENAHTPPVEVSAYVAEGMFTTSRTQAGIKEIKEEYYLSTSRETTTGDYWRTSAPVWQPDRYIWTRSHVYYTDGTDATYGEVCSTGAPGFSYAANMLGGAGRQLGPNTAYQLGAYGYAEAPVPGKTYTLTVCYKVGAKDTSIAVFVDNKGYYKIKGLTARVETVEAFRFTCPTPSNSSSPKLDRLAFFHQPNDGDYDGTNTYVKWAVLVEGDNPARAWVPSAAEMAAGVNELRNATFANGSDYWAMSSKSRVDITPGFAGAGVNSAVWEVSGDTSRHWRGISQGTFSNGKPAVRVGGVDVTIPTSPGDVWTASVHTLCPDFRKIDDPGDPDAKPPVPVGTVTLENRAMCEIQFYNASGAKIKTVQYSIMPTEQEKWQRHHLTVVAPDGAAYVGLYHWLLANGTLYMSKPMLSRGATLGDWTPSPLDTSYLQQALQNDASLEGGLVLATLASMGYKAENGEYVTMAGISGIYDANKPGGGIAFWGGGPMKDLAEYYYWDSLSNEWKPRSNSTPPLVAKSVDRMNGSGYRAGGNLWWDEEGNTTFVGAINAVGSFGGLCRKRKTVITAKNYEQYLSVKQGIVHFSFERTGQYVELEAWPSGIPVSSLYLPNDLSLVGETIIIVNRTARDIGVTGFLSLPTVSQEVSPQSFGIASGHCAAYTAKLKIDSYDGLGKVVWELHANMVPIPPQTGH